MWWMGNESRVNRLTGDNEWKRHRLDRDVDTKRAAFRIKSSSILSRWNPVESAWRKVDTTADDPRTERRRVPHINCLSRGGESKSFGKRKLRDRKDHAKSLREFFPYTPNNRCVSNTITRCKFQINTMRYLILTNFRKISLQFQLSWDKANGAIEI